MTTIDLPPRGSGASEENTGSEPTPAPHTAGSETRGGRGEELTRTRARVRARLSLTDLPKVPELRLGRFFVRDAESPLRDTFPRCKERIDYALHGEWTVPPEVDDEGRAHYSAPRYVYLLLTVLLACPLALALDLVDWLTFPLGRLAVASIVLVIAFVII